MEDNIILLGYMGSGKSAVGKALAKKIGAIFVDLDAYIEQKEEETIANIFAKKGEIYFRKLETKYLKEVLGNSNNTILSLGGGTPCFGNNMDVINSVQNTLSIYLQTSIATLVNRLYNERAKRPLIAHTSSKEQLSEFIAKHLFERSTYYNKARLTVKTDNKQIEELVSVILGQKRA